MKEICPQLNKEDQLLMERLLKLGEIKHKYAVRLQTVLLRASGKEVMEVSEFLRVNKSTVSRLVRRYNERGVEGLLKDKTRKPGTLPISQELKNAICTTVCSEKPKNATHWSRTSLSKRFNVSASSVGRILQEANLKPHLVKRFTFSKDENFEEKLTDVVGLYLNPPDNALVLCVDEKTQIQALERSQPIFPILRKVPERQSHDYFRHGTTTLFAALDVLTGNVIGDCNKTHKSVDFIKFLKKVNKSCERGKVLHVILDNYSTHKTKEVKEFIEKRNGRFVFHFTPTHASWLNLVERWFAELTNKRIRRESWKSVQELVTAIKLFIDDWNKLGKPFMWTKSPDSIFNSIEKAKLHATLSV